MTLEREIYSIETANINKETLDAMKNAGAAMKNIHAGLTIDKVDDVMLVLPKHPHPHPSPLLSLT
jgi:charged multivesicular body protein 4